MQRVFLACHLALASGAAAPQKPGVAWRGCTAGAEFGDLEAEGGGGGSSSCCSEAEAETREDGVEVEVVGVRPRSGVARGGGYCHSGMGRAALFLGRKFGPLLRPLHDQGCSITLVGHSLGAGEQSADIRRRRLTAAAAPQLEERAAAFPPQLPVRPSPCPAHASLSGVASLLAVFLRRSYGLGPERLHCYAFEAPACMDLELALSCTGTPLPACLPAAAAAGIHPLCTQDAVRAAQCACHCAAPALPRCPLCIAGYPAITACPALPRPAPPCLQMW